MVTFSGVASSFADRVAKLSAPIFRGSRTRSPTRRQQRVVRFRICPWKTAWVWHTRTAASPGQIAGSILPFVQVLRAITISEAIPQLPCSDRSGPDCALVTGRSRSERSQQAKGYFYLNRQGEYVCHPCFVRLGSKLWTSPTRSTSPADAAHIKNVIRPLIREVRL